MQQLIAQLNEAGKAYYQENREIMSNYEYDKLYDELVALEKETNTVFANSPTIHVGYELLTELVKEPHESPMLSLDKTKEVGELESWLGNQEGILSWKLDGLTIVLTYEEGQLVKAVTRGNGQIGEVITNNAKTFVNLPGKIDFKGKLVIRGEAIIKYSDFEKMNARIQDVDAKYKNPRNLCSGSVRQLNNKVTAERNVHFYAFALVSAEGIALDNSVEQRFRWLDELGFQTVEYKRVTAETIRDTVQEFSERVSVIDEPSDGLVLIYDDIAYGESLGMTAKFPRNSIAFKWADETAVTKLLHIEWSPSRTGLINPVAVFEPVELEGSTVSRASLHNVSIVESLELGEGDEISVYKANMIIPQVAENFTRSNTLKPAAFCPACGADTVVKEENGVKALYCSNEFCSAKKLKLFGHFVSRDAMNIDGMSEATLGKMIEQGFLDELYDLYDLYKYKETIVEMEGFGEKSYENMIASIQNSKEVMMPNFIYALGIFNVGLSNARLICRYFHSDWSKIKSATVEELVEIDGIGQVIAESIVHYFGNEHNQKVLAKLEELLTLVPMEERSEEAAIFDGVNFVVTGSVHIFKNRKEVKEKVEGLGGKVTGSVTSKTNYLINNDVNSSSSKNKKAKELGIPIITEEQFLEMME
jgi:DNA ligase (NAD+)